MVPLRVKWDHREWDHRFGRGEPYFLAEPTCLFVDADMQYIKRIGIVQPRAHGKRQSNGNLDNDTNDPAAVPVTKGVLGNGLSSSPNRHASVSLAAPVALWQRGEEMNREKRMGRTC
jgi:hypothetical protein